MRNIFLACAALLAVTSCTTSLPLDTDAATDAPVCCPMEGPTCDCFSTGRRLPSGMCERVCDAAPPATTRTGTDGCPYLEATGSCLGDGGGPG